MGESRTRVVQRRRLDSIPFLFRLQGEGVGSPVQRFLTAAWINKDLQRMFTIFLNTSFHSHCCNEFCCSPPSSAMERGCIRGKCRPLMQQHGSRTSETSTC